MEQQIQTPNPIQTQTVSGQGPANQPLASTPPVTPVQSSASAPIPVQNKSHVWAWVLGGCFMVVIIGIVAVVVLGWWGIRTAKKEIEKYGPDVESVRQNIDRMNKQGEEWEKKSREFQESLPNPEDFSKDFPATE